MSTSPGTACLMEIIGIGFGLASLGAGRPAPRWYFWADAWILMGSLLATYAMVRGWNEFWLRASRAGRPDDEPAEGGSAPAN